MNQWDKKPPNSAKPATLFSTAAKNSQRTRRKQVRQPQQGCLAGIDPKSFGSPPAHHSKRLLIQLNDWWRVIEDDLQFILQKRKGNARTKAKGWNPRAFCRTREALLRCIREYCGLVDDKALEQVRALPEWH